MLLSTIKSYALEAILNFNQVKVMQPHKAYKAYKVKHNYEAIIGHITSWSSYMM